MLRIACFELEAATPRLILAGARRAGGRFTLHEFGLDGDFGGVLSLAFDAIEQTLRGGFPHAIQWLPHCCQTGAIESGAWDIVETEHGYILGHKQSLLLKRTNGTDGGDV